MIGVMHDTALLAELADTIITMEAGRIVDRTLSVPRSSVVSTAIREATEADYPGCWRSTPSPASTTARCCRSTKSRVLFAKFKSYPDYHVYVAVDDAGEIVGTFAMAIMDNLGHLGAPSDWSKTSPCAGPAGARASASR